MSAPTNTPANTGTDESQVNAVSRRKKGEFVRGVSRFRSILGENPDFPAEPGRYHLFVALNCPWCHRVTLARNILGLEKSITMDVAFPNRTNDDDPIEANRWEFNPGRIASLTGATLPECTAETATGKQFRLARHIYQAEGSEGTSVPILYDKRTRRIVANESAEIIRMLAKQAGPLGSSTPDKDRPDLYPEGDENGPIRDQIDKLNILVYVNIGTAKGTGSISTLTFDLDITVEPISSDNPLAPTHRVLGRSPRGKLVECGGIWKKQNKDGLATHPPGPAAALNSWRTCQP